MSSVPRYNSYLNHRRNLWLTLAVTLPLPKNHHMSFKSGSGSQITSMACPQFESVTVSVLVTVFSLTHFLAVFLAVTLRR